MKTDRKKLKWIFLPILILPLFITSCDDDDDEDLVGNWVELSDFEGVPRSDAISFTIGEMAYVGLGYDGDDRLSDVWSYDPDKDTWREIAEFPGNARNGAVAFGIGTKGYVGTGYDGTDKLNDFWEYDPDTDTWTQKADFPGSERYGAIGISANGKGYIGTGYDGNYLKDWWEYDPDSDSWTQKVSVGGSKRRDAFAFVINDQVYVCGGVDNGVYEEDFWVYDPLNDEWTGLRDIDDTSDDDYDDEYDITRTNAVAFAASGKAWIVSGGQGTIGSTTWEYDPVNDLWEEKTSLEGSARMDAVGFVLNETCYIATGRSSSYYFDDLWKFEPDEEEDDTDK